jgi:ATP-dependent RNA helicase RhlE
MQFNELQLDDALLRALTSLGYETPTPIQQQAIPHMLQGKDLMGCAQTGTGKTAAFALPILQRLVKVPRRKRGVIRALVLSPTRELATQIGDNVQAYAKFTGLRQVTIFGGVKQYRQEQALRRGADVLIATPGRLLDLLGQNILDLSAVEVLVLDEADRMLDMGFINDVRKIVNLTPAQRQTVMFSATMPADIVALANQILTDPLHVEVTPQATTVDRITQGVFHVQKKDKSALLQHILTDDNIRRILVFTRTKHGADKLVEQLERANIRANAIHSDKSQNARQRALSDFKNGRTRLLVATDIAARGIDVDGVTHVINYDLPLEAEVYVHRIGRTARNGASGIAYSFCDADERKLLRDVERLIRLSVPVIGEHPYAVEVPMDAPRRNQRPYGSRDARGTREGGNRRNDRPYSSRDGNRKEGERSPFSGAPRRREGERTSYSAQPRRQDDERR